MSENLTETPEQGCVNQECAETIKTHPESWKAWKREAERLQSFISHASMIEIACENPSVNDHMVHWEGRAIKAETALSAPDEQAVACSTDPNARHGFDRNASHSEGRYVCECESTPAAEQRAEAMGRDAARYQWLRDDSDGFEVTVRELDDDGGEIWVAGYPPNELDLAVDAAIASGAGESDNG